MFLSFITFFPRMVKNDSKSPGGSLFFFTKELPVFRLSAALQDPGDAPESAFEFQATKIKTMVGGLAPGLGWLCGQVGFCFFGHLKQLEGR